MAVAMTWGMPKRQFPENESFTNDVAHGREPRAPGGGPLRKGAAVVGFERIETGAHMSTDDNRTLELPADLAAFAQELVDAGHYASVADVVRDAFVLLQERADKVDDLRKALDVGIAQLDAGEGARSTPREMMDGIRADIGLSRKS